MRFNVVVSTKASAVRLWESMGFAAVERLPAAFEHPSEGFVDALVMLRELSDRAREALRSNRELMSAKSRVAPPAFG